MKKKAMNKKAMISQPMGGLSDDEIMKTRDKAKEYLESLGYEVLNTFYQDGTEVLDRRKHVGLAYLSKSLFDMSDCDAVYFCKGWKQKRGCILERMAATHYDLDILDEDGDTTPLWGMPEMDIDDARVRDELSRFNIEPMNPYALTDYLKTGNLCLDECMLKLLREPFKTKDELRNELEEAEADSVNHPDYYEDPSGVECIEVARHRDFNVGNALKYLWRAGLKHEEGKTDKAKQIEDLRKAVWYLNDEIKMLEEDEDE